MSCHSRLRPPRRAQQRQKIREKACQLAHELGLPAPSFAHLVDLPRVRTILWRIAAAAVVAMGILALIYSSAWLPADPVFSFFARLSILFAIQANFALTLAPVSYFRSSSPWRQRGWQARAG